MGCNSCGDWSWYQNIGILESRTLILGMGYHDIGIWGIWDIDTLECFWSSQLVVGVFAVAGADIRIFRYHNWYQDIGISDIDTLEYFWNSQLGVGVLAVAGADTAELLVRSYVSQSHTELLTIETLKHWIWNSFTVRVIFFLWRSQGSWTKLCHKESH